MSTVSPLIRVRPLACHPASPRPLPLLKTKLQYLRLVPWRSFRAGPHSALVCCMGTRGTVSTACTCTYWLDCHPESSPHQHAVSTTHILHSTPGSSFHIHTPYPILHHILTPYFTSSPYTPHSTSHTPYPTPHTHTHAPHAILTPHTSPLAPPN